MLNHYFAKPNISPDELIRKTIFLIVSMVLTITLIGYLFGFFNNLPQPNQSVTGLPSLSGLCAVFMQ